MPAQRGRCDADERLVDRFLRGDRAAFDALVLRYQDRIHRFVAWSIGREEADDAAQDVFVEAYRSLASWNRRSTFRTWLYGVARNVCRHHARAMTKRPETRDLASLPDSASEPLQHLAASRETATLQAAIARLPEEQRMTLLLRAWEGLSYDEIAATTDVPKGTVRSRLHNARRTLAHAIAEMNDA